MGHPESDSALLVIAEHGSKLGKLKRLSKDILVKSLRQVATALSQVEQPSPEDARRTCAVGNLEKAVAPLRDTIVNHSLWKHSDKDVRILVAICASELFRLLAPEPPFEDRNIRDVFELFLRVFKELDDIDSTYLPKRVKILETVSRCKCYLILLDIDCDDLILDMFETFFSVVREQHPHALHNDVLSIMTNILCEDVPHALVEVILRQLINDNEGAIPASSRLAISVIQSCQDKIRPVVCGFLASCSFDKGGEGSDLKASYHEIVFKIFQHAPEMLQDFIPTLNQELLTDQVDARIKVVRLIGKLFSLSGYHIAQSQHDLFVDFLKRFSDKSAEVRIAALQCAKDCCLVNLLGKESQQLMSALESRLWDVDDKVRVEAVTVACDLATSNLKFVSPRLISAATERLRDKKVSVRKKAFQKLMEVYRHYCSECAKGHMTIFDDFEDITCKILMLSYDKDSPNFKLPNMEIVIAEELFPISLSVEDRVLHWIHLYSLFGPLHRKAFCSILTQKRRLQEEMQHYLSLRKQEKEKSSDDMQKKIKSSFVKMSNSFLDPSSAEDYFNKLNQMKDHNIFTLLELLLDEVSLVSAQATKDRFMKIVGDKLPQVEFFRLLSSKCSPNIFDSKHVQLILNYIRKSGSVDTNLVAASFDLLLDITSNFPSLLKGSELQLKVLIEEHLTSDKLIQVLAKAGSKISVNFSEFYPCLKKLCLKGTRAQAKCAVYAISSLLDGSDQLVLAELCEELADSLLRGENASTVLQSLGCIAQCSVLAYKAQQARVESYIYENILQDELLADPRLVDLYCASSWKLKIYGLKTIIMSFSSHGGPDVKQKIDKLLGLLLQMLQKCEISPSTISSDDTADMRLAASKSILQLSRRCDLLVPPDVFRLTISTAMDPSYSVKRLFLEKVHKLLKEHAIPRRYACAFALATTDSLKDIQDSAYQYMEGFILRYRNEARSRQHSSVHEAPSITAHPAYVVLFLIHFLAHDANFPADACQDEEIYARFCWPLFSFLWALLDATIVANDLVHNAAFCLHYIFRAIKKAEDAVAAKQTPRLHFLAEVGNSVLRLLLPNGISATQSPGQILLPSSFYRLNTSKRSSEDISNGTDQTLIDKIVRRFQSLLVNRIRHCRESCHVDGASNVVPVKHDFSSVLGKNGTLSSNSLGTINSKRHVSKKRKNGAYANPDAASSKEEYLFCKSVNTSFSQEQLSFGKVEQSLGSWKENAVASEVFAAEPSNDLKRCTKRPSGAKEAILADKSNTLSLQPLTDTCAARVKKGKRLSVEASSVSEICDLTREVSKTRRRKV